MATPYELLGISPDATRQELDAAYAAKRAEYDPGRVRNLPEEFVHLAAQRRAELASAHIHLRTVLAAPRRLAPAVERRRDHETLLTVLMLVVLGLMPVLLRHVAVPERTVVARGAEAAALTSSAAPDFTLPALDGKLVSLSDFKGKVVLINFWATWCPPCVREIPRLMRVAEKYRGHGFVLLGVNTTYQDDRVKVAQFVREQGIAYPVLLDVEGVAGQKYPARLIPTSYLIDRDGKVVHTKVGEVDEAALDEQIAALLDRTATAP